MARIIQTATGTIAAAQMGFCSVHEHVTPSAWRPDQRAFVIEYALKRLQRAYDLGLRTLVEVSPWSDAGILREIAIASPVRIICCTGFYTDFSGPRANYSTEDFASHMLRDVEFGLQGSGLPVGVIKIASSKAEPDGVERRALEAAGKVQCASGLPLCVHSVTGCQHQQEILGDAGADLSRVYFCHIEATQGWEGRTLDAQLELLQGVLARGSYLSLNNFGNWQHTPQHSMAALIQGIAQTGYADRLLATMDFAWSFVDDAPVVLWEDICEDGSRRDYGYLISDVQPWLRSQGIDEAIIHAMNHENPARLFG